MMLEGLLVVLILAVVGLTLAVVALWRRLWLLMGSVECLCNHVSAARGGHAHDN
jgi:hypothetical protein